ncbi:hypothetical protein F4820DRAFT_440726 [Hypoxylon rubiginosum]|uniref:Uncharacterized protein n=1 Tax=Hypoxylon rubiginosum TaxID=110542 RepID=A0ACB9YIG6_9PEZI|nr:hypothetical protein F4820DRAFT_440726 [Hypoxylon rubiginosum]
MDNLSDLLEWHISKKNRMLVGYGINNCDYEGQAWTTVAISVDSVINENGVVRMLQRFENDINQRLSRDQKPQRLAFCVEDNSNNSYWAKSRRVEGTLSAIDAARQMEVVSGSAPEDGEKTRPATPRPEMEEATRRNVIEVEL